LPSNWAWPYEKHLLLCGQLLALRLGRLTTTFAYSLSCGGSLGQSDQHRAGSLAFIPRTNLLLALKVQHLLGVKVVPSARQQNSRAAFHSLDHHIEARVVVQRHLLARHEAKVKHGQSRLLDEHCGTDSFGLWSE